MPSENERQGRSSNIFFFTTVYCRDTLQGLPTQWGTNIYSLPLAVQIGPFPGQNERCPVERMPPVLGPMHHA
jgi:hypothetical protein